MSDRFFSAVPIRTGSVRLVDSEAHHLLHVMRAQVGDELVLFDGSGAEFDAEVTALERRAVALRIRNRRMVCREVSLSLTLGVALPKGDRQRWLVEKAVELGVRTLVPLQTTRSVSVPTESALQRLRRTVVEASKQCGRNRLLDIREPLPLPRFIGDKPAADMGLLTDLDGDLYQPAVRASAINAMWAAIGPEGGWDADELALARDAGWQITCLGRRVLRVETAAIAIAALLCHGD